ncbi:hypothetical protein K435DRAFT_793988 [Dendrothele bispora CBS 962.96]|uniref:Uncharacterized protein n=1 Tax=Dendrothele bispora (strain CBS 962.96) TaxID=1314807 RepID=A0A4V4HGY2_DENBC|nr:hypothetical protein K435DRAFT_793988 [Dendrothele bispora CBS 962.96]
MLLPIYLPIDILVPIGENADRPTVRNLCLTSRQVCTVVRPYVFRDLHVSSTQNLPKLIAFMSRSSNRNIAACVHSLTFHCNNGHWPSDKATALLDQVIQLVDAIPVRSLCFEGLGGGMGTETLQPYAWTGEGLLNAVGVAGNLGCLEISDSLFSPDGLADLLSFDGRGLRVFKMTRVAVDVGANGDLAVLNLGRWMVGRRQPGDSSKVECLQLFDCNVWALVLVACVLFAGHHWHVRELRFMPKVRPNMASTVEGLQRLLDTTLPERLEQLWFYAPPNHALRWTSDVADLLSSCLSRMPSLHTVGLAMILNTDVALRFTWNPRTLEFSFLETRFQDTRRYRSTEQKLDKASFFAFLNSLAKYPSSPWSSLEDGWQLYQCHMVQDDRYKASWTFGTFEKSDISTAWLTALLEFSDYMI